MSADNTRNETRAQRLEIFAVYVLCVVLLGAMGVLWLVQRGFFRPGVVPIHRDRLEKPIELNTAPWWELSLVRGIGEVRAKQIVALRERTIAGQKAKGKKPVGFRSLDNLTEVPGISADILEEMRQSVRVEPRVK
jgi:DNA uptake protein ComE-like DNA-binding protein